MAQASSEVILRRTFAIAIVTADNSTGTFSDQTLSVLLGSSFNFQDIETDNVVLGSASGATASIRVPGSFSNGLSLGGQARLVCSVYVSRGLFLRRQPYLEERGLRYKRVGSIIISANLAGSDMQVPDLQDPVQLTFLKDPVSLH